jgi:hypothetical protein
MKQYKRLKRFFCLGQATQSFPDINAPSISNTAPSPAPEPGRSAAEESSASGQESQLPFKDMKDTALNTLRLSLSLVTTISGSIPVPGLKAVFSGLEMVLGWFDVNSLLCC